MYNNNRDLAYFIIQCGARVRPWSWMESQHLPEPLRQDKLLLNMIQSASRQPQKLVLICVNSVRLVMISFLRDCHYSWHTIYLFIFALLERCYLSVKEEEVLWTGLINFPAKQSSRRSSGLNVPQPRENKILENYTDYRKQQKFKHLNIDQINPLPHSIIWYYVRTIYHLRFAWILQFQQLTLLC